MSNVAMNLVCTFARLSPATALMLDAKSGAAPAAKCSSARRSKTQRDFYTVKSARQDLAALKQRFIYLVLQVSFRPGVYTSSGSNNLTRGKYLHV